MPGEIAPCPPGRHERRPDGRGLRRPRGPGPRPRAGHHDGPAGGGPVEGGSGRPARRGRRGVRHPPDADGATRVDGPGVGPGPRCPDGGLDPRGRSAGQPAGPGPHRGAHAGPARHRRAARSAGRADPAAGPGVRPRGGQLGSLRRGVGPDRPVPVGRGRDRRGPHRHRSPPARRRAGRRRRPPAQGRGRRPGRCRVFRRGQLVQRQPRRPVVLAAAGGDHGREPGRQPPARGGEGGAQRRGAGGGPRRLGLDRGQQP